MPSTETTTDGRALEEKPIDSADLEILAELHDDYLKPAAQDPSFTGRFLQVAAPTASPPTATTAPNAVHLTDCKYLAGLAGISFAIAVFSQMDSCCADRFLFTPREVLINETTVKPKSPLMGLTFIIAQIVGAISAYKTVEYVFFAETPKLLLDKGGMCSLVAVLGVLNAVAIVVMVGGTCLKALHHPKAKCNLFYEDKK